MNTARYVATFLVLMILDCASGHGQVVLSCLIPSNPSGMEIVQRSREENSRFRQAPHGATRPSKHRLEIMWTGGTRVFQDEPPYDEPLDGIQWTYCGYDRATGIYLIGKRDIDVFTGMLLDDRTGSLMPGGELVNFSPNREYYLAYEQPDGQDGETIKLCNRRGTLLWKGFNGILSPDGKSVVAEFQSIHWDSQAMLIADFSSPEGRKRSLRLAKVSTGKWGWIPTTP
jgi:hypothetical protein